MYRVSTNMSVLVGQCNATMLNVLHARIASTLWYSSTLQQNVGAFTITLWIGCVLDVSKKYAEATRKYHCEWLFRPLNYIQGLNANPSLHLV